MKIKDLNNPEALAIIRANRTPENPTGCGAIENGKPLPCPGCAMEYWLDQPPDDFDVHPLIRLMSGLFGKDQVPTRRELLGEVSHGHAMRLFTGGYQEAARYIDAATDAKTVNHRPAKRPDYLTVVALPAPTTDGPPAA
jgi:hypothetical protein